MEKYTPTQYCESRKAPPTCAKSSVCQIRVNGSAVALGRFDLTDTATVTPVDSHVFSVRAKDGDQRPSVVRHVCKPGDLASVPVHVGTLSGGTHEFHWASAAACPTGTSVGDDCAVTQEGTGFVFDLSPISSIAFNRSDQGFSYEIAVCGPVNSTHCDDRSAGVCQRSGASEYKSAGQYNDALSYVDGSLKLVYSNGTACRKVPGAQRNSTLLFQCDRHAHSPVVSSVAEVDYCQYLVEVSTKLACPPAFRATECIYISPEGDKFDFSPLVKSLGGWQASGPRGATVHMNLCQPLSGRVGCHPLASVCSVGGSTGGSTGYRTLGLAGSANFSFVRDHIVLKYNFTDPQPEAGECGVVETMIEFVCSNASGPVSLLTSPHHPLPLPAPAHFPHHPLPLPAPAHFPPSSLPTSPHHPFPLPPIIPSHFPPSSLPTSPHHPLPLPGPAHFPPSSPPTSSPLPLLVCGMYSHSVQ